MSAGDRSALLEVEAKSRSESCTRRGAYQVTMVVHLKCGWLLRNFHDQIKCVLSLDLTADILIELTLSAKELLLTVEVVGEEKSARLFTCYVLAQAEVLVPAPAMLFLLQ